MRRTVLALAAATAFATLASVGGCAIIVVPEDGSTQFKSGFSSDAVQGNGQAAVEKRQIGEVDGIDIRGPLQVEVRVGEATSLQIEGDSNLLPLLRTDAAGGTLRVWIDGSIRSNQPLRLVLTTPQLRQIQTSGSGRLNVSGLNGGNLSLSQTGSRAVQLSGSVARLELRLNGSGSVSAAGLRSGSTLASLNGSGHLDLGRLEGDTLSLDVHGSGGVNASGKVRSMNVRTYGSGSAELMGLSSKSADLSASGSGSISASVSDTLVADSSGSGRVTVYGNPAQRNVSGKRVSVLQ